MNLRAMQWSWTAASAFVALACMGGSLLADGPTAVVLLGGGIAVATVAVMSQIIGSLRAGHTR